MKYLIQHSANVEISNNFGKYPLQDPFILNMFKAALDDNGNTILHHAIKAHDLNKVLLLLNATVNLDIKNKDGNTALHLAAIGHDERIFKLLLQSKADINIKNIYGKTAIDLGISNGIEVYPLLYKYNVSAYQELNYKHRHHHGESNNRAEHHKDNKTILGHHRVHRDIEDVQQIEKDDHNYISNSVGNVEVMSSSSAGSSIKPIGYSMVNWIRDNVSKLKYLFKHAKKEIVSNKEMALHGEITELFYEDCIRYLEQKIKDCEEEDTRLVEYATRIRKTIKNTTRSVLY